MNRKLLGDWGEAQTAAHLRKRGFQILASQYRCRFGEVDIIAKEGEVLCFIEVIKYFAVAGVAAAIHSFLK